MYKEHSRHKQIGECDFLKLQTDYCTSLNKSNTHNRRPSPNISSVNDSSLCLNKYSTITTTTNSTVPYTPTNQF